MRIEINHEKLSYFASNMYQEVLPSISFVPLGPYTVHHTLYGQLGEYSVGCGLFVGNFFGIILSLLPLRCEMLN